VSVCVAMWHYLPYLIAFLLPVFGIHCGKDAFVRISFAVMIYFGALSGVKYVFKDNLVRTFSKTPFSTKLHYIYIIIIINLFQFE